MNQIENTKKYQDMYRKYKELVIKTTIRTYTVIAGEKIEIQNISVKDLESREETEKELKGGLQFLTDNQLIDLSNDLELAKEAQEVLMKRKEIL